MKLMELRRHRGGEINGRTGRVGLALFLLCLSAGAQSWNQLAAPANPLPFPYADSRGEIVNLEFPLLKPLLLTRGGQHLAAINQLDGTIAFHDPQTLSVVAEVWVGQGASSLAERRIAGSSTTPAVHELWVSCANDVKVIDLNALRVVDVVRPPLVGTAVGAPDTASPAGVAFSADGTKAWVVASFDASLLVYDANTRALLNRVPLEVPHLGGMVRAHQPKALVRVGDVLFVLVYKSGNDSFVLPRNVVLGHADTIFSESATTLVDVLDADLLALDANNESLIAHLDGVGAINFNLLAHSNGSLFASAWDAKNAEFVGEKSFLDGRIIHNKLQQIAFSGGAFTSSQLRSLEDFSFQGNTHQGAFPTDLVEGANGLIYVACAASNSVVITDGAGAPQGVLASEEGPRGVAYSATLDRLYVYNKDAATISWFDNPATTPMAAGSVGIGRIDVRYDQWKRGEILFNDASHSKDGTTGCWSCHPHGDDDGLVWELSKYNGPPAAYDRLNLPPFFKDQKGPMVTQNLRSLEGIAPYHWRGEQKDIEDFNGTFEDLLHGSQLNSADLADLKAYIFSLAYAPNPLQPLNRMFSPQASTGLNIFDTVPAEPSPTPVRTCVDCHAHPASTDGAITDPHAIGTELTASTRAVETAHLIGGCFKISPVYESVTVGGGASIPLTRRGSGFSHSGNIPSQRDFLDLFGSFNTSQRDDTAQFVEEFDNMLAPFTTLCEYLDLNHQAFGAIQGFAIPQAEAGFGELGAKGRVQISGVWIPIGLLYVPLIGTPGGGSFVSSDPSQLAPLTWTQLQGLIASGRAELLFSGAPLGSGERFFLDRDRDGLLDGDEATLGSFAFDPDTDNDGFWDGEDPNPLLPDATTPHPAPAVTDVAVSMITTRSFRVSWTTDRLSPSTLEYGATTGYGSQAGDPLTLPAGSNHWKRRHVVFVRRLGSSTLTNFRILTRGQNGQVGSGANHVVGTDSEEFSPTLRCALFDLQVVQTGTDQQFWLFSANVVDELGNPISGAALNVQWTIFDAAGNVLTQVADDAFDPPPTDAAGNTFLGVPTNWPDGSNFKIQVTLPMVRTLGPAGQSGIEGPNGEDHSWSNNVSTCASAISP